MLINNYFSEDGKSIQFTRQQGSDFAKKVAGDFNPIHDADAKRFCVPGDLLFTLVLHKYGLNQQMRFTFSGMVSEATPLNFPDSNSESLVISDNNGKEYLSIERRGDISTNQTLISELSRNYVEFSGQTFPNILVPLMQAHNVMINPERPMVIYESMAIDMDRLDISAPKLELANSSLEVNGKRGNVRLEFKLIAEGEVVGRGEKNMVLSGLRDYDQDQVQQLVDDYAARKQAYSN